MGIFDVNNHSNLSGFFSMNNKNLGAHFLLTWVTSIFKPIFDKAKSYKIIDNFPQSGPAFQECTE